jgi:nucleotide-binding universal stress UspA family protein
MNKPMKLLIAHDGSRFSDDAVEDLARAGLPKEAEAVVLSVAEVWLPETDEPVPEKIARAFPAVEAARRRARESLREARAVADKAAESVRRRFPAWTVRAEAKAGSPGWVIVGQAEETQSDLIVVGSQGRSAWNRMTLGSVSHQVLLQARRSVRIGRAAASLKSDPPRLIVAVDGSPGAERAIQSVAGRSWPGGTQIRVVAVIDDAMATMPSLLSPSVSRWFEENDAPGYLWVKRFVEAAAKELQGPERNVEMVVREGNPKKVIVEEAQAWKSDSVFLGARGLTVGAQFLLGSVSAAVAAHAPCSVEVIHHKF